MWNAPPALEVCCLAIKIYTLSQDSSITPANTRRARNPPEMVKHLNPAAARERRSIYLGSGFTVKIEIESEVFPEGRAKKLGGSFNVT
jgi:hypothetical protein